MTREAVSDPLANIKEHYQKVLAYVGKLKHRNKGAGNSISFFPLVTKNAAVKINTSPPPPKNTPRVSGHQQSSWPWYPRLLRDQG